MSLRETIRSTIPCSSRNSERWKPGGSCWRIVCSITRGPAKPISASGSAIVMSPSIATEAATPPVVGCTSTAMYGTFASRRRARAADVFAICISERTPSCIRAPPEAQNMIAGRRSATARSNWRVIFSPTTDPIEPPMNSNTKNPTSTGMPPMVAEPARYASPAPTLRVVDFTWSTYFLPSTRKPSGSPLSSVRSCSCQEPASMVSAIRVSVGIRKWWLQLVHTRALSSRSAS